MSVVPRLIVEVVPDVTGIDKTFDYLVPADLEDLVRIGDKVRFDLNGRRVAGWVISRRTEVGDLAHLKSILKRSGIGPEEDVVSLCHWAAHRWCVTRLRPFLVAASSHTLVARPAPKRRAFVNAEPRSPAARDLLARGGGVLRLPPTSDQLPAILSAAALGPTLVVCSSVDASRILAARLRRAGVNTALMPQDWHIARGGVDVTIGARSAAFAPCPDLAAAVVLDEHVESMQEERMPTWHARDVLAERCRRNDVPLLLVSPCPTVVGTHQRIIVAPPKVRERAGWPEVEVVDRTDEPPWNRSLISTRVTELVRDPSLRVVCVVNTKGMATLLACRECQALVRCEKCASTMVEDPQGHLECSMCGETRPRLCGACASTTLSRLRPGTSRLRAELEKIANRPVAEMVSGADRLDDEFDERQFDIFVGTSAALHRLHRADVVVFLDFDRELLAPRFSAHEQAMGLLALAARLVGARDRGGRIVVQTTLVDHDVIRAAVAGDMSILTEAEVLRRQLLDLPPYSALAIVEGEGIEECLDQLQSVSSIGVSRHRKRLLLRAPSHEELSKAWLALPLSIRSSVRIEVDPISV